MSLIQTQISNGFKLYSNLFKLLPLQKKDLLGLENFKIKYGCEGFDERNNYLHRNFFRFEMSFELKFGEVKVYFLTLGN
jgi:hypothetical protein